MECFFCACSQPRALNQRLTFHTSLCIVQNLFFKIWGFQETKQNVATLKEVAPCVLKAVPALVAQLPLVAKDMSAQNVSNSLWAGATLKEAAPDILQTVPALVAQVPVIAKHMNAQNLSNSLWAAATLKEAAPDVLQTVPALVAQVTVVAKDINAQGMSNSLWAAATFS